MGRPLFEYLSSLPAHAYLQAVLIFWLIFNALLAAGLLAHYWRTEIQPTKKKALAGDQLAETEGA